MYSSLEEIDLEIDLDISLKNLFGRDFLEIYLRTNFI